MSQKTLNLCLERYNFVKFGETTKSTHTVLCTNNAHSVNSDKYRLTPAAVASKHGEGYVFTLNYDFDRPLFTIVQKSYSIDGTSGKIVFEGIDPISKAGSKYLRRVEVSPVKLSDGSYLLEVTKDEYLRIGTTGAALGDEDLESLNEKIVAVGGIEKSVETVGGKQVLKLDASGSAGAKEIVYFDFDPSHPPSGIHTAIGEALSNNKLPVIRSDGKLYQYTGTSGYRYDFVSMFTNSDVGYEVLSVDIGNAVVVNKLEASLGYVAVPENGTEESPAWAKVCELEPAVGLLAPASYTTYGLALLFNQDRAHNNNESVTSGMFVLDVGTDQYRNSNGCNASWMAYTPGTDEYSKILGIKLIAKYGVPRNPAYHPYPVYKVEVWVKYYGSNPFLVNALQNAMYNYSHGMIQGPYKFPESRKADTQTTEPHYEDTEEYIYREYYYTTPESVDDKVYNMYILSQDDPASPGETPSDEDQWVCDENKHVITKDEILEAHAECRCFILNNAIEPASNSRKYFAAVTNITNFYVQLRFYMIEYSSEGVAKFYQKTVSDDSEGRLYISNSYSATLAGVNQAVLVSEPQNFDSTQKAQGRDNIGAASASDVTELQSQVSSLSDVSAYTVKGEATVAQLNAGPSGIQAGWAYQLTDSGTLTAGSLAVVAGDTVAWDGTKWFPLVTLDYYAIMGEVVAAALDALDARIRSIEEAISATNLGERTADRLDVQTLLVGGEDVTDRLNNI